MAEAASICDPNWDLASFPVIEIALVKHLGSADRGDDPGGLMLERAENKNRLILVPSDDRLECGDLCGVDWQDVAILIIDRAGGELEELVDKHACGWCRDLSILDLCEHLLLQSLVLLASFGWHDRSDIDHAGGWKVGFITDQDKRDVSELSIDRLLGSCHELVGVAHVVGRVEVGFAVGGVGLAEAFAVVEHLDLHEEVEVVVRDRCAGQTPAALDAGEVLVQSLESFALWILRKAEFIDDQRVHRADERLALREHLRQAAR